MNKPDKNRLYKHIEGGIFEIWRDEDFSDDTILLYEKNTGEDFSCSLENFHKYFSVIDN